MERGARRQFFRRILGENLGSESCTKFYRELEFCCKDLHLHYSKYLKLPFWERKMYEIYLDIRDKKQEQERLKQEDEQRKLTHKGYG